MFKLFVSVCMKFHKLMINLNNFSTVILKSLNKMFI